MMPASQATEQQLMPVDVHFARTLMKIGGESIPFVEWVLQRLSLASRLGDVCISLHQFDVLSRCEQDGLQLTDAMALLRSSKLFGSGSTDAPLVLDNSGRIYMKRFWRAEARLVDQICQKSAPPVDMPHSAVDRAIALAAHSRFIVVTGGPGAGKTTLVSTMLGTLLEADDSLQIVACAPTGKAAVRLQSSIERCRVSSDFTTRFSPQIASLLPTRVQTIHRLLSPIGDTGKFRFSSDRQLPLDVLVVDEASMVDVQLMGALFDAVPKRGKVILLGDPGQLSSIEPGRVLGDICYGATARVAPKNAHVANCIVRLEGSHRFDAQSAIGKLARAVNTGNVDEAVELATSGSESEITFVDVRKRGALQQLVAQISETFLGGAALSQPGEKLDRLESMRVLCAVNHGPFGVYPINQMVETHLFEQGVIQTGETFYENQPILITQNNYRVSLFNGDTGVICLEEGQLKAAFRTEEGRIRFLPISALGAHLPAYATTIHKAQGSEYDNVIIVLPDSELPILTRELLYTAITRAKLKLTIFATPDILRRCVSTRTSRTFSMAHRLWGFDPFSEIPDSSV